jgi:hypothetical protein
MTEVKDRLGEVWQVNPEWGGETVLVIASQGNLHDVFVLKAGEKGITRMGEVTVFGEAMFLSDHSTRIL